MDSVSPATLKTVKIAQIPMSAHNLDAQMDILTTPITLAPSISVFPAYTHVKVATPRVTA